MIYRGPETMLGTRRGGSVAFRLVGGNRRGVRRRALACLAFVLLVGLVGRAPTASAATGAYQSPLAGNPFAVGDAASFSADPSTSPAPPTQYEEAVLADKPTLYLPLTETGGTTAFDHSGNGFDGTYDLGVKHEGPGPLLDEPNVAVFGNGEVVSQSGDKLPSGSEPRTLELWVHNTATQSITLARYGNIEGGHGFAVTLHYSTLTVEASGHKVSVLTVDGFGGWCCDSSGWHMVNVTYDGQAVEIYQDGQLLGGGELGKAETEGPGQGLRLDTSYTECCGAAPPYGLGELAVYPSALSPEQIGTHWSAGASLHEQPECAATPTGPYPKAVLEDSPLLYYRVGEMAAHPADRISYDSSGHCYNGTFDLGTNAGVGALPGDEDAAIYGNGQVVFQSGDKLPSGSKPRTLELWVHNTATQSITLARYGNIEGGHGFAVRLHYETLSVEASGHAVSAHTLDGFGGWCCDSTGWHMVDVTYDGEKVNIYQDGQLIESKTLGGEAETEVPGQGLRLDTSYTECCGSAPPYGLDEAAIYPSALSSASILAHWEAASKAPAGEAVIGGTALYGGGGRVQACPAGGGKCLVDANAIEASGFFHMLVPDGTYTVTIFPPPGSSDGSKTLRPMTVPPSETNLHVVFAVPGNLAEGMSLSSPGRGTQENTVPGLNWGEPSTLTVHGCQHGGGMAYLSGANSSTGQPEIRATALTETPAGSGTYIAHFAPFAPIHGLAGFDPQVACNGDTSLLPNGGSSHGGNTVTLFGSGFDSASIVMFGGSAASSFHVYSDNVLTAVVPAGTGTVTVAVATASGSTPVGSFSYFDVNSVAPATGPTTGGTLVTIHGHGFTDVKAVIFGLVPATSFTVVNATEIQAEAPPGLGTVGIQVSNGIAISPLSPAVQYTYSGGQPGSASIVEPISDGQGPVSSLSNQVLNYCATATCPTSLVQGAQEWMASPASASPATGGLNLGDLTNTLGLGSGVALAGICLALGPDPAAAACVAVAVANQVFWWAMGELFAHHDCKGVDAQSFLCRVLIDPSGTVVDTSGSPVAGATATLLGQIAEGEPFSPVAASSGAIEPATNPETTGASGQFDWNALAGAYEVQASAPECHAPGHASEPNVFTSPFVIPPPAVGLTLTLECPGSAPPIPSVTGLSPASGPTAGGNTVEHPWGRPGGHDRCSVRRDARGVHQGALAVCGCGGRTGRGVDRERHGDDAGRDQHPRRSDDVLVCCTRRDAGRPDCDLCVAGERVRVGRDARDDQGQQPDRSVRCRLRQHSGFAGDGSFVNRSPGGGSSACIPRAGGRLGDHA